jgi:hypothetical protein
VFEHGESPRAQYHEEARREKSNRRRDARDEGVKRATSAVGATTQSLMACGGSMGKGDLFLTGSLRNAVLRRKVGQRYRQQASPRAATSRGGGIPLSIEVEAEPALH